GSDQLPGEHRQQLWLFVRSGLLENNVLTVDPTQITHGTEEEVASDPLGRWSKAQQNTDTQHAISPLRGTADWRNGTSQRGQQESAAVHYWSTASARRSS